jgi:AraC family transcriptional regulator of adaptative response / DNA-3-methyladenine glycosylase II
MTLCPTLDPDVCYAAVQARDERFDGHFFFGVSSTGVYCRPVCRARLPKRENCSFYATAAAAGEAGFRPCLRCRPALALRDKDRKPPPLIHTDKPLHFALTYRPPYDFSALLDFLAARAIAGVESADGQGYRRVLAVEDKGTTHLGWIEVTSDPEPSQLRLRMAPSLAPVAAKVLARTQQVFDTQADPQAIAATLGDLSAGSEGLRLPGSFDPFELAVRAVLGQQVTVKAARTLAQRFAQAFGTPVQTPIPELARRFPAPDSVARLDRDAIASLGIIGRRAEAILALAQAMAEHRLHLDSTVPAETALAALCALPGIGPWTAQYIVMRALS